MFLSVSYNLYVDTKHHNPHHAVLYSVMFSEIIPTKSVNLFEWSVSTSVCKAELTELQ